MIIDQHHDWDPLNPTDTKKLELQEKVDTPLDQHLSNPHREDLSKLMEKIISLVQTGLKKSTQPDACVASTTKNQEQETNVVDIFLEKGKNKNKSVHSGRLAQEIFKSVKIPPKVKTSLDLDADDLRWTETLYSNLDLDLPQSSVAEETETFTKKFL